MKKDHPLTAEINTIVTRLIRETVFGSLVFVVQDSRIVQLERNEKFQFPAGGARAQPPLWGSKSAAPEPLPGLVAALADLQFGQVVVKIQAGRAVQIDRTEKRRWSDLMGVGGDGI